MLTDAAGACVNICLVAVWVIFILMELTDLGDGFFARLLKQETELGKILDPFADSICRITCFLGFTLTGFMPIWVFVIVLYRDLWVSFIRIIAARKGSVMGARLLGKIKAWVYALAGIVGLLCFTAKRVLIFNTYYDTLYTFCTIGFYCVALIALGSAIDYSTVLFDRKKANKK
jgi:CDP-diacylglycerol--glycerol-3-phosphate 3-phosphatidyltransferase